MAAEAELASELQRSRNELAGLKVNLEVFAGEKDRLLDEDDVLKKERDKAKASVLESETD